MILALLQVIILSFTILTLAYAMNYEEDLDKYL